MIFSSFQFLIFFSFFLLFIKYFRSQQKVIIILFSLFFYISWNPIFIFLIFYLSLITYICFKKKISTYITLVFIFLPLIYFKYSEFIFNILNYDKLASLSYKSDLPLAISFITFTAVAFIIDAKKKFLMMKFLFLVFWNL